MTVNQDIIHYNVRIKQPKIKFPRPQAKNASISRNWLN